MDAFFRSEVTVRETRPSDGIPADYWGKSSMPWQVQALSGINGTMVILPAVKSVSRDPATGEITIKLDGSNPNVKWDPLPPPPPPVTVGPVDLEQKLRELLALFGSGGLK